jgi:hypothetical protein
MLNPMNVSDEPSPIITIPITIVFLFIAVLLFKLYFG